MQVEIADARVVWMLGLSYSGAGAWEVITIPFRISCPPSKSKATKAKPIHGSTLRVDFAIFDLTLPQTRGIVVHPLQFL